MNDPNTPRVEQCRSCQAPIRWCKHRSTGRPALMDAGGQRHRLSDLVATIDLLERQYLRARQTPGRSSGPVVRGLGRALAQRYVYLYLLDGQPGLLTQRGIDVHTN